MTATIAAARGTPREDTTLGSTRDGQLMLAVWWGDLAMDYARHGSSANARAAASTAAHFGHFVLSSTLAREDESEEKGAPP
jgi:hypothetical protein